jgi:flagellar motor switch protein FliN/FliY
MADEENSRPAPEELQELLHDDNPLPPPAEPAAKMKTPKAKMPIDSVPRGLEFLYDIPLQVSVEVGRTKILLRDLLQMGEGYVIELDKLAGEPLDLFVNQRLIARGEAVMVGEKFAIRLTDVVSTLDRLEHLS